VANFPDSPGIGSVFVDTTSGFQYKWTGVVWKSFTAAAAENISELDDISSSFDNSTTTFNLTTNSVAFTPQSAAQMQISLGGVIQEPSTDYTISGSTITFTTAPNAGLDFFGVVRGTAVAIDYANDGNVQTKQEFTATEGQTSFTITGGYTAGYIDVFRNGVRLAADDITISSGTAVVLTTPAQAGDIIETVKYEVASVVVTQGNFTNQNISGVATVGILTGATSIQSGVYYGDGSALTGIDASSLKSGSDIKAQANPGGIVITGVATASSGFVGNVTGNATGLSGTPNITVGSLSATSGTVSGNLSVGGTLTYQDVTNMDVLGIGTFQQGIQILANGASVTGIVTVGLTTIKTGEIEVTGVVTATTIKAGTAISITDGAVSATRFHGDGSNLTGIDATTLKDSGGNIKVQANPNGIVITGIATATDFDSTSDERLKTNIQVVDGALDKVNRLRGVSFEWKESGEPSYGVIAQELESVLPELVHGDDPKRVNYNGIIGVLIESIKELSARVDELENK